MQLSKIFKTAVLGGALTIGATGCGTLYIHTEPLPPPVVVYPPRPVVVYPAPPPVVVYPRPVVIYPAPPHHPHR